MPLELATRLILREEDGRPLAPARVREICARWAEVPDATTATVDDVAGRGNSRVTTRESSVDDRRRRWDLDLSRADDDDPSVAWTVQLTAVFESDRTTLVARLRRDSHDQGLRPLTGSPVPPRVVGDVLAAAGVESYDGPIRMQARYRELAAEEVDGFVRLQLLASDRRLPIIAVAKSAGSEVGRLNVKQLTKQLAGFGHLVLVDRAALSVLGKQLENLSLAPGAARVWWSGLELDDASSAHPHWPGPFDDPGAVVEALRTQVLDVSRDRWREPDRVTRFDRDLRQLRDQAGRAAAARVVEEVARLREAAAADRAKVEQAPPASPAPTVDIEAYETQLGEMATDIAEVNAELDRQRELAEIAVGQLEESEAKVAALEWGRRSLQAQVDGLKAKLKAQPSAGGLPVQTEEDQFRADVVAAWNDRLTPHDREDHPLVAFEIREGFVDSIVASGADRQKVVATVMEVACGRAKDIEGRKLHRLRAGAGGNSPERSRDRDGATAWRCNVQTGAASARRLHYWSCPGGKPEFACVVTHDDFAIPE